MNGFSRYLLSMLLLLLAGIASAEIETVTWLHTDHLGSPLMARDAQGNTLWQEDYSPWGERLAAPSANSADIGYTGHYEEADIGLTYAQARWYDPAVGRFLSADPVGFHMSGVAFFSRYTYANHSPYIYWDPDGRASRSEEWAALDGPGSDPAIAGARGAEAVADGAAAFGDAIEPEPDALSAVPGGYFLGKLRKFARGADDVVKGVTRSLDDLSSLRGAKLSDVEKMADAKYLQQGWTKSPLRDGNGVRYFDGKGNSFQLNNGYPGGKEMHGGPYIKTTQGNQTIRIPLEGNPDL